MELSQSDIARILSWWEFIEELGETDEDPNEADLVKRLRAHSETAIDVPARIARGSSRQT